MEVNYEYYDEVKKSNKDFKTYNEAKKANKDFNNFLFGLDESRFKSVKFKKFSASYVWKDQISLLKDFIYDAKKEKKDLVVMSEREYFEDYWELCKG